MQECCRHIDLIVCCNLHILALNKDLQALWATASGKILCIRRPLMPILYWSHHNLLMILTLITVLFWQIVYETSMQLPANQSLKKYLLLLYLLYYITLL